MIDLAPRIISSQSDSLIKQVYYQSRKIINFYSDK